MSISQRLKFVIAEKNMNIKEFSEAVGIPYRSIQNYLLEDRDPSVEALKKLSEHLSINLHWLITGNGTAFYSKQPSEISDPKELDLLDNYRDCNEICKIAIIELSNILYKNSD